MLLQRLVDVAAASLIVDVVNRVPSLRFRDESNVLTAIVTSAN